MTLVTCPKCKNLIEVDISKAVDENGEEYMCSNCNYVIRYA